MSFGFDNEDFELELEGASSGGGFGGDGGGAQRKRQKPMVVAGPEITFAKAGRFEVKTTNKQGKEVKKYPAELQVVILDAKFGRQQWVAEEGRNKLACATIAYEVKNRDGSVKEVDSGFWQLPYGAAITNQRYNPTGTKVKADGTPMTCTECFAAGQNEGCGQKGGTYVYVVGMTNEDDEMVAIQNPFIATIKTPPASGIAFQIYARQKLLEGGYRPSQVVTKLGVAPTPNGLANQLVFELEDRVEPAVYEAALEAYKVAEATWNDIEAEKAAERRAKFEKNKKGAHAAAADKVNFSATDDDFSF